MRFLTAALLTASVLLAGCGTDGGPGSTGRVDDGPSATDGTRLTIELRARPNAEPVTFTLRCDPPGGDHPDPTAACRELDALETPFAPVPRRVMCTEQYGGPQTATVAGTFRGEQVRAEFDRTNGCEISRWDQHAALLAGTDTRR